MTGLVMELSHLFSILSDRSLEVMLAELVIRKKNLQKNSGNCFSCPGIIVVPHSGQRPMQQCFISANGAAVMYRS